MKLVEGNAFISIHPKIAHGRAIAFRHIESYADSLVVDNGLGRDFYLLKAVVFIKVLNVLGALAREFCAIRPVLDDPFSFLYINLGGEIAAA
jgi:hypothetical protein